MQPAQKSDLAAHTRGQQPGALLALFTIVGIIAYVILNVIAQMLPPHYSALSQAESELAVGPYGFVMTINFVIRGLLSLALVWALSRTTAMSGRSHAGLALLTVWGIGALVLAIFPTDPPWSNTYAARRHSPGRRAAGLYLWSRGRTPPGASLHQR